MRHSRNTHIGMAAGIGFVLASVVLLSGCPNAVAERVAEDVLVSKAGGRPTITSQIPEPGATDVLSDTVIEVQFDMALAADAPDFLTVTAGGPEANAVPGTTAYNEETRTLSFEPETALSVESSYQVTISGDLRNAGGAAIAEETSWTFDTTLVNPDQFRFDVDLSGLGVDLSTYRTYISVDPESGASDSPLNGSVYGGAFGSNHSFLIEPDAVGASSTDRLIVTVITLETELVPTNTPNDPNDPLYYFADDTANRLFWRGYRGSTGSLYPSGYLLDSSSGEYGSAGLPLGVAYTFNALANDTIREDIFFTRGEVHALSPDDAFYRLDYQNIQDRSVDVPLDSERRIQVPERYGLTAVTFTSDGDGGNHEFRYGRDSGDNRDTYSQLWLFERVGDAYEPARFDLDGDATDDPTRAVSTEYVPTFDPYDEGGQFGDLTWQVPDSNGDPVTALPLAAGTEYLLVVDSWLHVPTDGSGQLDSGAYDLLIDSTP